MSGRRSNLMLGLVIAAVLGVGALSYARGETRVAIAREKNAPNRRSRSSCLAANQPLRIAIVPDAVIERSHRERIEYHAELTSGFATQSAVAWTATLIDDRGTELATLDKGEARLAAFGTTSSKTLSPGALTDGTYCVRVSAVIAGAGDGDAALDAIQPFAITDGTVTELSYDEWFKSARADDASSTHDSGKP